MKLTYTHESDYRRERDFGAKIGATFEFLSSQFKPFVKCLAYFVLPGALLMGIGFGLFMGKMTSFYGMLFKGARNGGANAMAGFDPLSLYRGWAGIGLALAFVGIMLAFLLLSSSVYAYLRVRLNLPADETVQPRQVWAWMWPRMGRMLLACLMLMGLGFGVMLVMGAVMGGIAFATGSSGWIILPIIALYVGLAWLSICLALYFPVLWLEDVGVGTALSRCFYLIKGKWWSTFGLILVISIIQSTISYLFAIPMYGLMFVQALQLTGGNESPLLMQAAALLYAGSAVLLMALPLLALAFQYFNLVERRDSIGALQQLALLGQTAAPEATNRYYQPDEEGEY